MRSAYTNRGTKAVLSRNNRSSSAQGEAMKALKKAPTPDAAGKKKEIMKLTIMNPSFKNETVIYNNGTTRKNRMTVVTPDKKSHEVMSAQLENEAQVFSSKNSAYSSVVSKRRSKNERRLGFGSSFGAE